MDFEELQFGGRAQKIAERDCSGSLREDEDNLITSHLYKQYVADGKPSDINSWLRKHLTPLFISLNAAPKWTETPEWPFLNGKPMVFIAQYSVGENRIAEEQLAPRTVLYLFGMRFLVPDGWEMRYRVIEQHEELANIARRRK